jgi:hypothetical protein
MLVTKKSPISGKVSSMELSITEAQLEAHKNGELAQNIFPNLSVEEREFLISGITPKEWNDLFGNMIFD